MIITAIHIYKFSIPMVPFTIATGTMSFAQNMLIKVYTNEGVVGIGECSAFPMIVGETQATCFEMAKEFANCWIGKNALEIDIRLQELDAFAANNFTAKSAFDLALFDISSKNAGLPLYKFLGGKLRNIESDLTIGINTPLFMANQAKEFVNKGVNILKVKLGKTPKEDVERIKEIRNAIGYNIVIRIDANQGWSFDDALFALNALEPYKIEFCEQPMRTYNNYLLPILLKQTSIKIMGDESVYNHYDAQQLIQNKATHYINIKFAKSGGINEAKKIIEVAKQHDVACMMGGMLESRVALTAKVHFAMANTQIKFYDLDTCLLGHKIDPVLGGLQYNGMKLLLDDAIGIGVEVQQDFLNSLDSILISS